MQHMSALLSNIKTTKIKSHINIDNLLLQQEEDYQLNLILLEKEYNSHVIHEVLTGTNSDRESKLINLMKNKHANLNIKYIHGECTKNNDNVYQDYQSVFIHKSIPLSNESDRKLEVENMKVEYIQRISDKLNDDEQDEKSYKKKCLDDVKA
jgi:hypothetical protein